MKIYFAGSIRGGREGQEAYFSIIAELQKYGEVLTEHIGSKELDDSGENNLADKDIFDRDLEWVEEADLVVAEVTNPSLGVGYELGRADALGKPVLCLHQVIEGKRLSAMIAGNDHFDIRSYRDLKEAREVLEGYFSSED